MLVRSGTNTKVLVPMKICICTLNLVYPKLKRTGGGLIPSNFSGLVGQMAAWYSDYSTAVYYQVSTDTRCRTWTAESQEIYAKSTWYTSMYVELTHLRVSDALHGRVHVAGVSQVVEPRHALRRRRRREDRRPPPRRRRPRRGRRARRGYRGCKLI